MLHVGIERVWVFRTVHFFGQLCLKLLYDAANFGYINDSLACSDVPIHEQPELLLNLMVLFALSPRKSFLNYSSCFLSISLS